MDDETIDEQPVEVDPNEPMDPEATVASFEDFFGFKLEDTEDGADDIDALLGTASSTDETPATDEAPAATAEAGDGGQGEEPAASVETPAAAPAKSDDGGQEETPAAGIDPAAPHGRDDQGRALSAEGVPLNRWGLPDISDEEWQEYLADEDAAPGEAQKAYLDYHRELERRQGIERDQLVEARAQEIESTKTFFDSRFEKATEARDFVHAEVERVLALVPAAERNRPGYYEWATKLVVADRLPDLFTQYGVKVAAAPAPAAEPATPPAKAPAAPKETTVNGKRMRVTHVEGGSTPPATAPPARPSTTETHGLTRDEIAFCKEVGMTPEEYAANK